MNMKHIETVAADTGKAWFLGVGEVARVLGVGRNTAAQFLRDNALPYRKVANAKKYFLPEVLEALDKTKWR